MGSRIDASRFVDVCTACMGVGAFRFERNGGLPPEIYPCSRCHGTGTLPPAPPAQTTKGERR